LASNVLQATLVSEYSFEEMVRYVRFGEADQEALRAFHAHAEEHFESIAEEFYSRIQEHPHAVEVITSPEQVARLQFTLTRWLDSMMTGPWDQAYYERRARIGRMHVRIKLPQRYMFTAMSVIRCRLLQIAAHAYRDDPDQCLSVSQALGRLLDVELGLMLETYREDSVAQMRRYEEVQRERLEQRLAITEARYEAVVENAEVVVISMDGEGRALLFNRKAEEMTGYHRDELLGNPCIDLLCHPANRAAVRGAVAQAIAGRRASPLEALMVSRDGQEHLLRWHVTRLPASDGHIACAIGLDITEEHDLAARTRRAERLASLGTLAAGLAHEIRNPLNAAQLQLMLVDRRVGKLEPSELTAKAQAAARVVRDELQRLAGLVEDFLAFARPRALRLESGELSLTVQNVCELMTPEATVAGVLLTTDIEEHTNARYDEERLKQVLMNILRNAIEASGEGGTVELVCKRLRRDALIEVSDDGPGLPEGMNVFEPFATTKEGGTGLGLPIVHRIVSDHGGEISVERRGNHTVFTIILPLDGPPGTA
jgi:PAS domain S-box-containing protein